MNTMTVFIFTMILCIIPFKSAFSETDNTKPLFCSVIKAIECGLENGCSEGTAESIDLPQFIQVDLIKNIISTTRTSKVKRESKVKNLQKIDGKLFMQGVERGRGWSMVIDENSGKMSASAIEERVSFVAFGACTVL